MKHSTNCQPDMSTSHSSRIRRVWYGLLLLGVMLLTAWPPVTHAETCAPAQWLGEYFSNETLSGFPAVTRCETKIDFPWGLGSPDPAIPVDHFSARWTQTREFSAGDYIFTLKMDDAAQLFVDNVLTIDLTGGPAGASKTATVTLTAGTHTLKVTYREVVSQGYISLTVTPPPGNAVSIAWPANDPVSLNTQRTVNVSFTNTGASTWSAGTKVPRITYKQRGSGWRTCATSIPADGLLISETVITPLATTIEPGQAITIPITLLWQQSSTPFINTIGCNGLTVTWSDVYALVELTEGGLPIPTSASITLKKTSATADLRVTSTDITALPEQTVSLNFTLTNIGPSIGTTATSNTKLSVNLVDPFTGITTTLTTPNISGYGLAAGAALSGTLTFPAPSVPRTYRLTNWSASMTGDIWNTNTTSTASFGLGGSPISPNTVTPLTVTPIAIQNSPLQQDGFRVSVPVSFPAAPPTHTTETIDCGTTPRQTFTSPTATCRYDKAGTYSVTGSYFSSTGILVSTRPSTITIPLLTPATGIMRLNASGIPAPDNAAVLQRYRVPTEVDLTLPLARPDGVGIIDPLDPATSTLQVVQGGSSIQSIALKDGPDPLTTTARATLPSGLLTLQLNGTTASGRSLSLSRTLTITRIPVQLTATPFVLTDIDHATSTITFPTNPDIRPIDIDCGTTPTQVIASASVTCEYTKAGNRQAVGHFLPLTETGTAPVVTLPLTSTVPALPPLNLRFTVLREDRPISMTPLTLYRYPAIVTLQIAMDRSTEPGILDAIDPSQAKLTLTSPGQEPLISRLSQPNPLLLQGPLAIKSAGNYTLTLEATTLSGTPMIATLAFTADLTAPTLSISPLRREDTIVAVDLAWSDNLTGNIQCGYRSRVINGPSGTCRYDVAGSFTLPATFRDPLTRETVSIPPLTVIVPSVAPIGANFTIASINDVIPSLDTTQSPPIATLETPSGYPLNVITTITPIPPDSPIGIVTPWDLDRSKITVTPLAGGTPEIFVARKLTDSPLLTARGAIRTIFAHPTRENTWAARLSANMFTTAGDTFPSTIILQGPIGGASPILLEVTRSVPRIPYAPMTVRYKVKKAITATKREPLTSVWTLLDANGNTLTTVPGKQLIAVLDKPGDYTVNMHISGPLAGTQTWTDHLTIPDLPTPDPLVILPRLPRFNRPPADYRFKLDTPKMADPRERLGTPNWTIDDTPITSPGAAITFLEPGDHSVSVEVTTSRNRTLQADTMVTVSENQPPTATIDCSRSRFYTKLNQYTLNCLADTHDPDGYVKKLSWVIPELEYKKDDASAMILTRDEPLALTVELHVTDNSGAESVISLPADMATFTTQ